MKKILTIVILLSSIHLYGQKPVKVACIGDSVTYGSLIDDREKTVIEPLMEKKGAPLYDFDLMQQGGHIAGYLVEGEEAERIEKAVMALGDAFTSRTGEENPFILAMGDGNHSLATAKACYEEMKAAHKAFLPQFFKGE